MLRALQSGEGVWVLSLMIKKVRKNVTFFMGIFLNTLRLISSSTALSEIRDIPSFAFIACFTAVVLPISAMTFRLSTAIPSLESLFSILMRVPEPDSLMTKG